jgi:hypothetical protein
MRRTWMSAILAIALAAGAGACSSSGGNPAAPATSAASSSAAPSSAAAPASTAASPSTAPGALPNYEPSKVVSDVGGHTQLSSPDSVSKVTAFYDEAIKSGGWSITSSAKTSASTNIVATRDGHGVTIAISSAGPAGTSISVSSYST